VTPFQSAGGRRPNAAASLLVHFAAQLMKKQIHVEEAGEEIERLVRSCRQFSVDPQTSRAKL